MQQTYKDILQQILDIIQYPNNKQQFIDEFQKMNREEAILNMIDRLPEDIQEKLKNNPDEIKNYVHDDKEYMTELTKVSEEALKQFIQDIIPTLTSEQRDKLEKLFSPVQQQS